MTKWQPSQAKYFDTRKKPARFPSGELRSKSSPSIPNGAGGPPPMRTPTGRVGPRGCQNLDEGSDEGIQRSSNLGRGEALQRAPPKKFPKGFIAL